MNYALAQEIYGGTPWMMDSISFMSMSAILKDSKNGVKLEIPQIKYNSPQLINNETRVITRPFGNGWEPGQLENNESFTGIGVVNLDGPITLSGGMSSFGMEQLSSMMLRMASDKRMIGFVVRANSGGGSSSAVSTMSDTILNVRKMGLKVYGSVKKGGMAASACYGILTACEKIFSEDEMNMVGSVGTMIQFEGRKANTTDPEGVKYIRLYATKSVKKNEDFEKALNEDSYDVLVSELLDPVNENFIKRTVSNRPVLKGTNFDDGRILFSKDVVGTFIDGFATFEEVLSMVEKDSSAKIKEVEKLNKNSNNNPNSSTKMNKAEIKSAHPEAYAEILAEGVSSERERVASWMAYNDADSKAVAEGIASGNAISQAQSHTFLVALAKKGNVDSKIADLKADSAKPVSTKETETEEKPVSADEAAEAEIKAAFNFTV